jgi:hypothetical protein
MVSTMPSKTKMIKAIRHIAMAYVDPDKGEVSVMISEEPRILALPKRHDCRVVHRLLQHIFKTKKNFTNPTDVWDALYEMCNTDNWEDQTWSLAHALGTPYDVGDEYTDIITVLCLGLIDNFVV